MKKQRFPQIAEACNLAVQEFITRFLKYSDGFASRIPDYPIYEGFETEMIQMGAIEIGKETDEPQDDGVSTSELQEISGRGAIQIDDIKQVNLSAFRKLLIEIGEGLNRERGHTLFSQLNTILDKAGRTSDAGGKPFTFELWLQTLETLEVTFDEQGNPNMPETVIPPAMKPTVDKVLQEANSDPEKIKAFRELINRKREVFNAKEANRKLVD